MGMSISDINDGELPRALSGLGQTRSGGIFTDGGTTVLQRGNTGPQVKRLQLLLNTFGYKLQPDSIFGPGTEAAVKVLQKKLGLAQTGIYDKALDERVNGMNQSGIVEPTGSELKQIAQAATATPSTQTVPGLVVNSTPPKPEQQDSAMVPAPGSVMEKLHQLVQPIADMLKVDPHKVVVGAGVVLGAGVAFVLWRMASGMKTTSVASPVETAAVNGLGVVRRKRRKSRKSKKSSKK